MNEKLNIQDLTDRLADKHGISKKDAETFVKEFFSLIEESLERDKYVRIKGLGTFKLIEVESRESVNVNTGERFEIEGHTKVSFTPEPALKDIINRPFAHFEPVPVNDGLDADALATTTETANEKAEDVPLPAVEPSPQEAVAIEAGLSVPADSASTTEEKEEASAIESDAAEEESDEKGAHWLKAGIGAGVIILLLCAFAVAYMYFPNLFRQNHPEDGTPEAAAAVVPDTLGTSRRRFLGADSVPAVSRDSSHIAVSHSSEAAKTAMQQEEDSPAQHAVTAFTPDSTSYAITGTQDTYTIKEGETLTGVALRFYGTKALYPYIVKHNQEVIANPNHVPAGTKIRIPKLEKK